MESTVGMTLGGNFGYQTIIGETGGMEAMGGEVFRETDSGWWAMECVAK